MSGLAAAPRPVVPSAAESGSRTRFRGDIEGMRAVAVVLVVLYHAGVPGLDGGYVGVDVFFVLSGFLITGLLVAELGRTGTISITRFYARRFRRLLPLAALVLATTAVVGSFVVNPLDVPRLGHDVVASALYAANWHFAAVSTDYLAGGATESALTHFWSLAVEEQFYVVWPLLLLLLARPRRDGGSAATARRVGLLLAVVAGGSLALSAWLTPTTGSWAYFGLHTRAWELAAGGAVAVALPLLRRVAPTRAAAAGWAGLVMVLLAAFLYDAGTVFPGTAALLPVVGTVLLVAAGAPEGARGTASLLALPPLRYLGRISYAWYLWHWPCLVLGAHLAGGAMTPWQTTAAVAVSFALAAASHVLVENPVRTNRRLAASTPLSLRLGAALTAVGVAAGLTLSPWLSWSEARGDVADLAVLESTVLGPGAQERWTGAPVMSAVDARRDQARPDDCYVSYGEEVAPDVGTCTLVEGSGPTVALVGDSHSAHWLPAVEALGEARDWTVVYYGKSACPPVDVRSWAAQLDREYTACAAWRASVLGRLAELPTLDAVLLARSQTHAETAVSDDGQRLDRATSSPTWEEGARRTFADLEPLADRVVVVEDTPWAPFDVPACLSEHPRDDWAACAFDRTDRVDTDEALVLAEEAADTDGRVQWLDTTTRLCPGETCPVVAANGGVMYADTSHMTNSFSRSLRDVLAAAVDALPDPGPLGPGGA